MKILVTGAGSFTAKHLIPLLQGRGEVFGTDVPSSEDRNYVAADLTQAASITEIVRRIEPDLVFHLAGVRNPDRALAVNLEGTRNLFQPLKELKAPPRFVFVSSAAVYGRIRPEETPVVEGTPFRPATPYGESKAAAELLARDFHRQGVARVVTVRPFNLVGPGLPGGLAASDFVAEALRVNRGEGEAVVRVGSLEPRRDFVDVRDAVRAYALLAEEPDAYGNAYNVGSGAGVAVGDLLERIMRLAGVSARVEIDPGRLRATELPELVADVSALRARTGWKPEIPLEQSLHDMIEEP